LYRQTHTALLFGTAFLFWTYYPHDLPLPTLVKGYNPARPDNPVTTNYSSPANFQRRSLEDKKARPRRQPDQVLGGSMAIEHRNV
jgi:hypothetical protein